MADLADADFFSDAEIVRDPAPYFHALRGKCPVFREPHHGSMIVTGYDAALEIYSRRGDVFSNCVSVAGPIPPLPFTPEGNDIRGQLDEHRQQLPWAEHIVCFDGDKHSAHRALLTRLLTHERLKQNEEYLQGIANRLIDRFIDQGRCEVVSQYSHAISTLAIADMLGIPETDRSELLDLLGPPPTSIEGDPEHKIAPDPLAYLEKKFAVYIGQRRASPQDDWMSELAQSHFKDGSIPDVTTLARLTSFVFGAGQDTSSKLIALAFRILAEDGALQERLRAERTRIPDFIEEVLRFETPTKVSFRLALETTTVADVRVPAGTVLTMGLAAGNRDPAHFDNPDAFDIDRRRVRDHLSFGKGAHACPGAPLARLEARLAIECFLDRASDIRIAEEEHGPASARRYHYEPLYMLRSLSELHLTFTANRSSG